jgi:hypothetical protein
VAENTSMSIEPTRQTPFTDPPHFQPNDMTSRLPSARRLRPSTAPRSQWVQRGSVTLEIAELLPQRQHRPLPADVALLERFAALMAEQGWPAQVSRLAFDRIYALERFSFAKRVGRGPLEGVALALLQVHHGLRDPKARDA